MFAVVKIAGQQYKVKAGQSLFVPHLAGNTGDKIEFSDILFLENEGNITLNSDTGVTVKADIVNDLVKGDKVIAFKMKRRKGFRKKHGHRTHYTQIRVTDIGGNDVPNSTDKNSSDDVVVNDTLNPVNNNNPNIIIDSNTVNE